MDREHRLFVAGREPTLLVVMNADTGKVVHAFAITQGADADPYDPKTGLIFVSTGEGWVHVFHQDSADTCSEAGKVKTEFGAKAMAYDPQTERIFVDTAEFGKSPAHHGTSVSTPSGGARNVPPACLCPMNRGI